MPRPLTALLVAATLLHTAPALADPAPLEPGPETTVYEGPLRDDGTVDYIAALNERMGEGVTNETNAFVALWQVRPHYQVRAEYDAWVAQELGLEIDEDRIAFETFYSFMLDDPGRNVTRDELNAIDREAYAGPFVGDDLPDIMAWLEHNERALDRVAAALQRPHYYSPWHINADNEAGLAIAAMLPYLSMHRTYARALQLRIHMAVGEDRVWDAINDLLALRRSGALVKREPTLISNLVGMSIDSISYAVLQQMLTHGGLTAVQLDRIEAGWPPQVGQLTIAQTIDLSERVIALDLLQQGWAGRLDDDPFAESLLADAPQYAGAYMLLRDDRFDINRALRKHNVVFDEMVEIVNLDSYDAYARQAEAFELELKNHPSDDDIELLGEIMRSADTSDLSGDEMTRLVVACLHRTFLPHTLRARGTEWVVAMRDELASLGFALERYKLDHDAYPDTLEALVPDYCDAVPTDVFDGEPMRYRPHEGGQSYLLYSVGRDQIDNHGGEEAGARDVVFRVGLHGEDAE